MTACLTVLTLTGCATSRADRQTEPSSGPSTTATITEASSVGRFASPNPGSVNVFWVPTPQGFVVVDSGRNVGGGRHVAEEFQRTGEPILAVLITHSHPDYVGGLGALHKAYPDAPIYASAATAAYMRDDPVMFYPLARRDDPDYPTTMTYPDHPFAPGATLELGGLRLETAEFDTGESEHATAYYEPESGALFAGDLTNHEATPALLEGHTCGWLTNLDRLRRRFPDARTIYSGHGAPARPGEEIQAQQTYLETFRQLVRRAVDPASPEGTTVTVAERTSVITDMDDRYPGYPSVAKLPTLKEENVAGVARELLAENSVSLPAVCG